ncbi:MAG: glycerophosphodiester phosphodiesterase family protein [Balneolaceae bacterium]
MLYLRKPMALWTVVVWVSVAILLTPLSSFLLGWGIFRGDQMIIGNLELIEWILTPAGAVYGVLVIVLAIISSVVHFAGLFYMITDDLEGSSPSVRYTVVKIIKHLPVIIRLCLAVAVMGISLILPLLAGLWGIYSIFLGEFDINYYLSVQPAEWQIALMAALIWGGCWLFAVLFISGKSLAALPAYLSGYRPVNKAIQQSWRLARNRSGRLLRLMLGSIGVWMLIRLVANLMFFLTASFVMDQIADFSTSLRPTILVTGIILIASFILDSVIVFFGFCFISTVLTKFYYEHTRLHLEAPSVPGITELPGRILTRTIPWLRPVRLIPILIILGAGSFTVSGFMLDRIPDAESVMISAHRAGPPSSPENTLSALEKTIESGADYSEIDAQLTRDSVVVLVHDVDLMRVAGNPRRIAQSDYADIRNIVQRPDDKTPPRMRRIATLGEFLDRAHQNISLMIELKYYGWDPLLAERVVQEVRERNMENEVVIMSLNLRALEQVRNLAPEIVTGYVASVVVGDVSRLPVQFVAIAHQAITLDLIRSLKTRDIELYVWTVNRAERMADMMERGVDGIITDHPSLGVQVRNEFRDLSAAERLMLRFRKFLVEMK